MVRASFSNTHVSCLCPRRRSSSTLAFFATSPFGSPVGSLFNCSTFFLSSSIAQHLQCFGTGPYIPSWSNAVLISQLPFRFWSRQHDSPQSCSARTGSGRLSLRYVSAASAVSYPVLTSLLAACSATATATIESAGDAAALATCTTYSGSIAVATGVAEDIDLGSIKVIKGDLSIEGNTVIKRFGGANLQTVSGKVNLDKVSEIVALSFPRLTEVDTLILKGCPNLLELEFTTGISKCDHLDIENTGLQNLNGINLDEAADIFIANNKQIDTINFSNITNITDFLTLSFNNAMVNVSFPVLESANNISLRAIGSLDIPRLSKINVGDFGVFESDNLESLAAPNLTKIDGALVINNNKGLKNISFDSLTEVGANLQIANNTNLHEMQGLPELKNVHAALDMSGNFSKYVLLLSAQGCANKL